MATCYRRLQPHSVIGVVYCLSPARPKVAKYYTHFNQLRDAAFRVAYSLSDWDYFLGQAGFEQSSSEAFSIQRRLGEWAVDADTKTMEQLRAMLLNAPSDIRDWYRLTATVGHSNYQDIIVTDIMVMMMAQKPDT